MLLSSLKQFVQLISNPCRFPVHHGTGYHGMAGSRGIAVFSRSGRELGCQGSNPAKVSVIPTLLG